MKLFMWTDRFSYLACAHAESAAEARKLLLETSDLGESGDGSCPELDRARRQILETTPSVFLGRVAEFAQMDSSSLRETATLAEGLQRDIKIRDLRIAELEAALQIAKTQLEKLTAFIGWLPADPQKMRDEHEAILEYLRQMAREVQMDNVQCAPGSGQEVPHA